MSCGCLKNAVKAAGQVAVAVTKAVIGVIATGKLIASLDVRKARMAACTECPHFLASDGVLGVRMLFASEGRTDYRGLPRRKMARTKRSRRHLNRIQI